MLVDRVWSNISFSYSTGYRKNYTCVQLYTLFRYILNTYSVTVCTICVESYIVYNNTFKAIFR